MAGKPPYFPFYPNDFSSDGKVEAMTTTEVGAYILLLCKAWREEPPGSIPDDDAILARWTRLDSASWLACKPRVLAPFALGSDGRWHQSRMRREFAALRAHARSRSEAGKAGAERRWGGKDDTTGKVDGNAIAQALPSQCGGNAEAVAKDSSSSSPSPSPSPSLHTNTPPPPKGEGAKANGKHPSELPLPPALDTPAFRLAWGHWCQHRKEKRKPLTPLATERQLASLAAMGPARAIAAIDHSIANGYQGIFELNAPRPTGGTSHGPSKRFTGSARLADDAPLDADDRRAGEGAGGAAGPA